MSNGTVPSHATINVTNALHTANVYTGPVDSAHIALGPGEYPAYTTAFGDPIELIVTETRSEGTYLAY